MLLPSTGKQIIALSELLNETYENLSKIITAEIESHDNSPSDFVALLEIRTAINEAIIKTDRLI